MTSQKSTIQLGEPFIQLLSVDSTNNYAHSLIINGDVKNGTAIFTGFQTNGRGQMGKAWNTTANQNILTSVIADISTIHLQNQFYLLAMAALACYDFFAQHTPTKPAIKWGNDIFYNDNKAGGILIETLKQNDKRYAIIGMGLNINQTEFDENIANATSLKLITHKSLDAVVATKELYKHLTFWYNELLKENYSEIHKQYNICLYKKGETVTLKKGNIKFNCTIKGVTTNGELEVENAVYDKFNFGEVQWII